MEEIMHLVFSKLRRSRFTAALFMLVGGLVILVTVYSVHPTASRFDAVMRPSASAGVAGRTAPGTASKQIPGIDTFFDYSLVFPEQPQTTTP
jgi:hypothetical protein